MRRMLFVVSAFLLGSACLAVADDPPVPKQQPAPKGNPAQEPLPPPKATPFPAQPFPVQPFPYQPFPGSMILPQAMTLSRLEEELESLEAHRDVRKAHVKAAEVAVQMAKVNVDRLQKAGKGTVSQEDVDRAILEVDAAKAQLEIRLAEMKEVDVKIKYAKKRLDEAKSMMPSPMPKNAFPPNPVPPKVIPEPPAKPIA